MDTKVVKRNDIPAGILFGTEVFVESGKAYAIREGITIAYETLPSWIKADFTKAFFKDKATVIKLWPNTGHTKSFINWLTCKCGKLDNTPDHNEDTGEIVADDNSFCGDCHCKGAGVLCSLPYNLPKDEVATIQLVKQGFTRDQIAIFLHRSPEAIKSRLEKSRIRLSAHNIAHLSSLTSLIPAL